ncbi:hypothetical protein CWATWH0003_3472 [Crocosphaera watsonii WH 0003]|uniref:Uncharacterized protein n=2 Tax=Crocosphaera watsonii TaxID=263511 RepID=G5J7N6_CROWT|nr:hypothetical protein CWATWH0003_3472 [Crocosphaera watsonii WH 0003]CCQ56582.1 hypothetical protein CWATWH0005_276 [Crocosphaera watsonii WH 0005]
MVVIFIFVLVLRSQENAFIYGNWVIDFFPYSQWDQQLLTPRLS